MGSPQADRTRFERALTIAESAQFRKAGYGDAAGSWVGNGPNGRSIGTEATPALPVSRDLDYQYT